MRVNTRMFLARILAIWLLLSFSTTGILAAAPVENNPPAPHFVESGVIEIRADSFGLPLANDALALQYDKPSVRLERGDSFRFHIFVKQAGEYIVLFDVAVPETVLITAPEAELRVDGALPVEDARRIIFPLDYRNSASEFPIDRYGNQIPVQPVRLAHWMQVPIRDVNFFHKYPLAISLSRGEHEFEFTLKREALLLGSIYLRPFSPDIPYEVYLSRQTATDTSGVLITIEAEWPSFKNDVSIRPLYNRSLEVTPYDTYQLVLNTLGGDSWKRSGSAVYYEV
ncbi:MAG: ABC transporter substrate-binding protein, partial [Anaerolineales bacterium]|nr:ABC transporter substrate-binding protein [Anaerolineales bacterium]